MSVESDQPVEIVPAEPADTLQPIITGPGNLTTEATSAACAVVTFTAGAVDGPVNVVANPASGSTFPLGTTPVGLATSASGTMAGSAGAAGSGQSQPTEGQGDQPHHERYDGPA